jgi:ParB-like chromosome segregation protein Spo0J
MIKVNAGNVKRSDLLHVDPFQVEMKEELRGRRYLPTESDVVNRALSILKHGQLQPVQARRVENNKLVLVLGFTRTAAVRLIREGFHCDNTFHHDPEFMLAVKVVDCQEKEAVIRNIVENNERNATSDIDDAHNQRRLKENHGFSDNDIASLYGYSSTVKVGRLRKLLRLSDEEQLLVHLGKLATSAAVELSDRPAEERAEIIKNLQQEEGKINGADVTDQIREHVMRDLPDDTDDDSDENEVKQQGYRSLSVRNIKAYFETLKEESPDPSVQRFAKDSLTWISGKVTNKAMDNAIRRLLDVSVESAA